MEKGRYVLYKFFKKLTYTFLNQSETYLLYLILIDLEINLLLNVLHNFFDYICAPGTEFWL